MLASFTKFALFVAPLALAGCGGSEVATGGGGDAANDDTSADSSWPRDAGPYIPPGPDAWGGSPDGGAWSAVCPDYPPNYGSACSQDASITCEYGGAWWSEACDVLVACSNGEWAPYNVCQPPFDGIGVCPPQPPGPNAASCPPGLGNVVGPCTNAGLICIYQQGASCACVTAANMPPDAGTSWSCLPGPGCPPTRPRAGASCDTEGLGCIYNRDPNDPTASRMPFFRCFGGTWVLKQSSTH
jgi:hypothetical protein